MERKDIITVQASFLTKTYDNTHVNQDYVKKFIWENSIRNPVHKGSCLITCHVEQAAVDS